MKAMLYLLLRLSDDEIKGVKSSIKAVENALKITEEEDSNGASRSLETKTVHLSPQNSP